MALPRAFAPFTLNHQDRNTTMIRDSKLRFMALAVVATLGAACDNGTEPGGLAGFDASGISAGVDAAFAPIDASNPANFALSSFLDWMAGGSSAVRAHEVTSRTPVTRIQSLMRQVGLDTEVDIPAEMRGQTFVYNPVEEVWEPDETRTGAPVDGVRVIWYATDDIGIAQPLDERGYIDLTDEDTATLDRLAVVIVRTAGTVTTLADFVHGYGATETETSWTETVEFSGTFSDGTTTAAVDISLDASGTVEGDEVYVWDIFLASAETSYHWSLDGGYDPTGSYDEDLVVTVDHAAALTIIDLHLTGSDVDGTGSGEGTLSHAGTTVANITSGGQQYLFSRPGGGSFTAQEENQLTLVTSTMLLYGPLMLISLPLIFAAF